VHKGYRDGVLGSEILTKTQPFLHSFSLCPVYTKRETEYIYMFQDEAGGK